MAVDRQYLPTQAVLTSGKTAHLGGDDIGLAVRADGQQTSHTVRRNQRQPGPLMVDPAVETQGHVGIARRYDRVDRRNRIDDDGVSVGWARSEHGSGSHHNDKSQKTEEGR